jgi:hypothetical protein
MGKAELEISFMWLGNISFWEHLQKLLPSGTKICLSPSGYKLES